MTEASSILVPPPAGIVDAFPVPPLVQELTAGRAHAITCKSGVVQCTTGNGGVLLSVRIADARQLETSVFVAAVTDAYNALRAASVELGVPEIIRIWNGIPGIHDRVDDGRLDRYMAFNAGRYAAMQGWYGNDAALARRVPSASGVGCDGSDLIIHAWASNGDARAIQNDRQVPATAYSSRYGPLPPCFSRATLTTISDVPTLLVSGTASILGEDSVHVGDLHAQLDLTCEHLAHVVRLSGIAPAGDERSAYVALRAYVPDAEAVAKIRTHLAAIFDNVGTVEFIRAQLCRRELLVEIEGIARRR